MSAFYDYEVFIFAIQNWALLLINFRINLWFQFIFQSTINWIAKTKLFVFIEAQLYVRFLFAFTQSQRSNTATMDQEVNCVGSILLCRMHISFERKNYLEENMVNSKLLILEISALQSKQWDVVLIFHEFTSSFDVRISMVKMKRFTFQELFKTERRSSEFNWAHTKCNVLHRI